MTAATLAVLAAMIGLFAAFAWGLSCLQQHVRQRTATPAEVRRSRHRPF